ncbi:M48 family metallopeptidase [Tannerella forsythia]|uniref:M48 family metallopeptidase n=1 Tax=Tannerella forsythia TaxID=28112 RepID=UPI0028DBAF7C|nr:M48 family metallopeptidase [Tannerella forsythia]
MRYLGIQTQQRRNNIRSMMMLLLFPCVILFLTWVFFVIIHVFFVSDDVAALYSWEDSWQIANESFLNAAPWVVGVCLVWFLIAYYSNTSIIHAATGSYTLERRDNKRVYNLVENLCMANGLPMPKINVIEDLSMNAFASGLNKKTYTVSLSRGIINRLSDAELEAVIAHELTHIRNRDVHVLIVSIVFVGIFSFLSRMASRRLLHGSLRNGKNGGGLAILLVVLVLAVIGYLITMLMRFAISRNREYMADAGSAEMTKNPLALASALRKISTDPLIEAVEQNDVAQLFIENPMKKGASFVNELFATHPPIEKRIRVLEQF